MANFSTKIFGLAGSAVVFAGMAFGQATCSGPASNANFVPVEATTAQVAPLTFTCTGATAGAKINVQVFLSPTLPITSKVTTSSSNTTEAVASVGAITAGDAAVGSVQGVLTGNSLTFSNITLTAGTNNITISNVRVNASSVAVGNGVPPAIQETPFISGAGAVPVALGSTTVAFVQSGISSKAFKGTTAVGNYVTGALVASPSSSAASFVICNPFKPSSSLPGSTLSVVQINENYATAFRSASEAPQVVSIAGTTLGNAVTTNDRLKLVFTNVPANVTLYVPVSAIPSQNGGGAAKVQLTSSETGAFSAVTASGASAVAVTVYTGGLAPVSVSSGTGTAVFDLQAEDLNNLDQFNIPVFIVTTANTVAGSSTPISVAASYAPVGSTQIPNFVVGSSTTQLTAGTFNLCTTSLLFPFVTNQLGFDTGLAISNTSTDPFGSNGATAQAGTCSLNFYGAGAPSPANVTTPNVPSGTTFTQVLSGVAAGFQGYIIAQCSFQYAHGFAFITDGVGVNGGLSQGYLAGVIPDVNQKSRGADPLSAAGAGSGETLGN
jgi:hypothetical protein